jgi:alpha-ketoglutarate-dependent taurine dioxygenase
MSTLTIKKLSPTIGAEISDIDLDRLLNDEDIPDLLWAALREHGVLLFHDLGFEIGSQVKFGWRLGEVDLTMGADYNEAGVMRVSMDPNKNGGQQTVRGTFNWHMDGCTKPPGEYPAPATVLTCTQVSKTGGQTEFTSTRAFYASLSAPERDKLDRLRIVHSIAGTRRRVMPDPTPEEEAAWFAQGHHEHPLVWKREEGYGRPSLIIGGTSDYIVGLEREESEALLNDLTERATVPERVYRHEWSVGDTVIWDNTGLLHRVEPYEEGSARELIRTTLIGHEATE